MLQELLQLVTAHDTGDSQMRIFITGASGFIGAAAATHFAQDHEVLAMSRSAASDDIIRKLGVTPIRCQLGGVTPEHLQGMDTIIHAAAKVEEWGKWSEYWAANVDGTTQLLKAAKASGVKTFIHIGTEASVFYGQNLHNIDETLPLALSAPYPYSRTKAHAEAAVVAANTDNFRTISVRPRMVWGPNDKTILPVILAMIKQNRFMWIDNGQALTSTTHIDNLIHGIDLALQKGIGGNAYFITDDGTRTLHEFFTRLARTKGITPPDKQIPGWLADVMARTFEAIWRLFGLTSTPPLTRIAVDLIRREGTINCEKAEHDLGYKPVISFDDGLRKLEKKTDL